MKYEFLINGELGQATDATYPVYKKADQSVMAEVPDASIEDIDAAVAAARAAQPAWKALHPAHKMAMLNRLADLMDQHADAIAEINGPEMGMPKLWPANGIRWFHSGLIRFYAGIADKQYGRVLESGTGPLNYTVQEPLGVVAHLLAWNTPMGAFTQKVPPSLIAGNTLVVRAADEAPLTTLYIARLVQEAGFPPGVINIVSGLGPKTGAYLVGHPGVDGVSFTGSVPTGRAIATTAAQSFKRTVLELGGKCPFLICEDADMEEAVQRAVAGAFGFQGQGCSAVSRVLIPESRKDELVDRITARVAAYKPALPEDTDESVPTFGPVFNRKQVETTLHFVDVAKKDGQLLTGGYRLEEAPFADGYYMQPGVALLENTDSELWKDEVFGPLFSVTPYKDEAHAIELANDCNFGLSGVVWSSNAGHARRIAEQLHFGTVWSNMVMHWTFHSPWGGFKSTGWGREFGVDSVKSFSEVKSIWVS
jgi:acyl-CoA reductase-like NAD-dependent aldehyde dehydrogenase